MSRQISLREAVSRLSASLGRQGPTTATRVKNVKKTVLKTKGKQRRESIPTGERLFFGPSTCFGFYV